MPYPSALHDVSILWRCRSQGAQTGYWTPLIRSQLPNDPTLQPLVLGQLGYFSPSSARIEPGVIRNHRFISLKRYWEKSPSC
jgi:hypothetical protein